MFAKNRKKKTEDQSGAAHTFYNDYIQKSVIGISFRTEPEASALIFMIHNCGEKYFFIEVFFTAFCFYGNSYRGKQKKLFQSYKQIGEFSKMNTVQDFFREERLISWQTAASKPIPQLMAKRQFCPLAVNSATSMGVHAVSDRMISRAFIGFFGRFILRQKSLPEPVGI